MTERRAVISVKCLFSMTFLPGAAPSWNGKESESESEWNGQDYNDESERGRGVFENKHSAEVESA
jgi:hypothetical protein